MAMLLMVSLIIMFRYSRKALKEEALQKAAQTLEATVQRIDNILLSVEQSSGNIYWKLINHLNQPDEMEKYRRHLVEGNPYISNCIISLDSTHALMTDMPRWTEPRKESGGKGEAYTSFCLPVYAKYRKAGLMAVDVPLALLSRIVLEAKPSPNSYCTLLGKDGSYIVHPDTTKLNYQTVFSLPSQTGDKTLNEAAHAMVSGETGYRHVRMDGEDYYVFFKPFKRSAVPGRYEEDLGWSVGIIYPEDDIFGDYNNLLYTVLIIAAVGLLLLLVLCQLFIHRQLLPLQQLARSAQNIANGDYDETIPDSNQHDEVGRLQKHFQQMQQSLSAHVGEMKQLSATLEERGKVLQTAYEQARAADDMKTSFLYNMTNQMMSPVSGIARSVKAIRDNINDISEEKTISLVDDIVHQGDKIISLLNQLISKSERKPLNRNIDY